MWPCTSFLPYFLILSATWASPTGINDQWGVVTSSGRITGHTAPDYSDVTEYLGIRYGQPTVGDLRFAAPVKYKAAGRHSYDASHFAPECPAIKGSNGTLPGQPYTKSEPRIIGYFLEEFPVEQGEDCLALNIWTKKSTNTKKPVLLWAYGGRFETGTSSSPFYHGQHLAHEEDIVVVTFNYRFGIFGFPGADTGAMNPGLLDARLAIEWLRDNIHAFGGDPDHITFAGHSAGAFLVDYYAFAWKDDPIVAGMILQSGTALTTPTNPPELTAEAFKNVSLALECNTKDTLACMRTKKWEDILAASGNVNAPSALAVPFYPTIDNRTIFSTADYKTKGDAGDVAKVPVLLGNADYEAGFYKIQLAAEGLYYNETFWYILSQRLATCPASVTSEQRSRAGIPTWRYRYFGQYPSLVLYPPNANGSSKGSEAYHGSELTVLWGTSKAVTLEKDSTGLKDMSKYLMRSWAAFARNPAQGLETLGWPGYDATGKSLVHLGDNGVNAATFGNSTEFDGDCTEILASFGG